MKISEIYKNIDYCIESGDIENAKILKQTLIDFFESLLEVSLEEEEYEIASICRDRLIEIKK